APEQVPGIVSKQYRVWQNREAFAFMDEAIQQGAAMWETAGALDGGRRVWMLARIPKTVEVTSKDVVKAYALLCMGHDGGLAIHVLPTTTRVVCQNTLNLALSPDGPRAMVVRHTEAMKGKNPLARQQLGIIGERVDQFEHQAQALQAVSMKETQLKDYVEQFFPTKIRPDFTDGAALLNSMVASKQAGGEMMRDLLAG